MVKVYKSVVSKWYLCACFGLSAAFVASLIVCYRAIWILLIDVVCCGPAIALMVDILMHTDYTISDDNLCIRCGVLYRIKVPIADIIEISRKSTILSSPALSLKRIGIRYGRRRWVYISPQNQKDFIADIRSINPAIIIS
ncbi:MAG: PH domain-containing protein [Muribaculaceae bacterium]